MQLASEPSYKHVEDFLECCRSLSGETDRYNNIEMLRAYH